MAPISCSEPRAAAYSDAVASAWPMTASMAPSSAVMPYTGRYRFFFTAAWDSWYRA